MLNPRIKRSVAARSSSCLSLRMPGLAGAPYRYLSSTPIPPVEKRNDAIKKRSAKSIPLRSSNSLFIVSAFVTLCIRLSSPVFRFGNSLNTERVPASYRKHSRREVKKFAEQTGRRRGGAQGRRRDDQEEEQDGGEETSRRPTPREKAEHGEELQEGDGDRQARITEVQALPRGHDEAADGPQAVQGLGRGAQAGQRVGQGALPGGLAMKVSRKSG